jgi:hypothetical protein
MEIQAPGPSGTAITPSAGTYNESAGSKFPIQASSSAPSEAACASGGYTFDQWLGSGNGNYTGISLSGNVTMNSNITEVAFYSCT